MGYATPGDYPISSSWQDHKNRNPPSKEPGTDFALPYGTDIRMAESGVIVIVDNNNAGAEGRRLELIMDNGEVIDYLHCSKIMGQWNQRVSKGQRGIALSGASGNGQDWYYGPHTHVTRRAKPGLPYADSIDFMLAVDGNNPSGGGGSPFDPVQEDDEMLMLNLHIGPNTHKVALGNKTFRHFIASDPYDKVMKVSRAADDWQDIDISELPAFLRTYGCDLNIWDCIDPKTGQSTNGAVAGAQFVVLDPLTGKTGAGAMWSAENVIRAQLSAQTTPGK